jgi:hypothetical protein
MATVKKGITVSAPKWWRHLRASAKRQFWKRQRISDKDFLRITREVLDDAHPEAVAAYRARLDDYRTQFQKGNKP